MRHTLQSTTNTLTFKFCARVPLLTRVLNEAADCCA